MVEPHPSSGGAEARAWPVPGHINPGGDPASSLDPPTLAPPPIASDSCVLLAPPENGEWLGQDHRRLERYPVQASRPIAVRLLDGNGQPKSRWFLADILDIGRGGLCLLVSGPMELPPDQKLQLDVRCHPDFGQLRVESVVRWCRSSIGFTTLGLAFRQLLPRIPRLELERRTVRRDPNDEAWAQD
jgi:hypothetical protein